MKILVSKPDSLGDQIIAAGLIQQLSEEYSEATIVWHVRHPMQVVSSILPGVEIFEPNLAKAPQEEFERFNQTFSKGIVILPLPIDPCAYWTAETETTLNWWLGFLREQTWDLTITALRNRTWLSDISAIATQAPRRIALTKTRAWQSYAETLRQDLNLESEFYTEEIEFTREETEYESYTRLFSSCSSKSDPKRIILNIPAPEDLPPKTVLFAPGVGFHDLRSWPIDKWIHLSQLLGEKGWSVSWIQGPGDDRFFANHPIPMEQRIYFGPDDLPALAASIKAADALVCNDSAYVHLSAAIGTPTLAFYGCGQNGRFIPNRGKVKVIQGMTIEAGSQWHNHCDIWASIREIPMDITLQAFNDLTEKRDTSYITIPIEIENAPEALRDPNTRAQFLDDYQQGFWENWSRSQAKRRESLKSQYS